MLCLHHCMQMSVFVFMSSCVLVCMCFCLCNVSLFLCLVCSVGRSRALAARCWSAKVGEQNWETEILCLIGCMKCFSYFVFISVSLTWASYLKIKGIENQNWFELFPWWELLVCQYHWFSVQNVTQRSVPSDVVSQGQEIWANAHETCKSL